MDRDAINTITHDPLHAPRADMIGEIVLFEHWARLMKKDYQSDDGSTLFDVIMWNLNGKAGQREATICATFIVWLGSNNGHAFLSIARDLHRKLKPFHNGFLAAWANTNQRNMKTGNGYRQIEMIMGYQPGDKGEAWGELTARDYETVDTLVEWLGTHHGYEFQESAEKDIARREAAKRAEARARHETLLAEHTNAAAKTRQNQFF